MGLPTIVELPLALCRLGEKSASHAKSRYIPEGWPGHSKVFGLPLDGMWEP